MGIAGIYCEPDNIEKHINIESDGMVYCQHCYYEAKAKIVKLEAEKKLLKEIAREGLDHWEYYCKAYLGDKTKIEDHEEYNKQLKALEK